MVVPSKIRVIKEAKAAIGRREIKMPMIHRKKLDKMP